MSSATSPGNSSSSASLAPAQQGVHVASLGYALAVRGLGGQAIPLDDGHLVEELRQHARREYTRDAASEHERVATQTVCPAAKCLRSDGVVRLGHRGYLPECFY